MRGVLLAILMLTAPLAGCPNVTEEPVRIEKASIPFGTLLTYEITDDGQRTTETFVATGEDGGVALWAHNLTRGDLGSPFLSLNAELTPRGFNWSNLFEFPLEPGDSYTATVGGADATVSTEAVSLELPNGSRDAIEATATADGETLATLTLLTEPTVFARIDVDTPDGTQETWELTRLEHRPSWNGVPDWDIGDWWTYNATTRGEHATPKLIYNAHDQNQKGERLRVLNPQTVESRIAAFPFLNLRDRDIAPQSGLVTNLLSGFWKWPLFEGQTWTGSTSAPGVDAYRTQVTVEKRITVPGGATTTAYTVTAHPANDPEADPIAEWQYAPLVGFLTYVWIDVPSRDDRILDWELTEWGEDFHGEIEIPRRVPLHTQNSTSGPAQIDETFEFSAPSERIQVRGTAVRQADATANVTIQLTAPDGSHPWRITQEDFQDRSISFNDDFDGANGTWHLEADLPQGVSFFAQIRGLHIEHRTVDYR